MEPSYRECSRALDFVQTLPQKYAPLGKGYIGRFNPERSFSIDLPHSGFPQEYKGIVAPITLDQDFWMDGDAFVSTAYRGRLPFSDVVQQALVKSEGYKAAIQAHENPLSAMAKHLFGEQDFDKRFEKAFSTGPGKKFYRALQTAQAPEDFHQAAMTYLTEIKDSRSLALMEILLAEALFYKSDEEK